MGVLTQSSAPSHEGCSPATSVFGGIAPWKAHELRWPSMAATVKLSQQPCTGSCMVPGKDSTASDTIAMETEFLGIYRFKVFLRDRHGNESWSQLLSVQGPGPKARVETPGRI